MPVQYQLVDPATGTLQYETLQAHTETQYYVQYGIDLVIIVLVALFFAKLMSKPNRFTKLFKR
jgi:hypothetical protein